MANPKVLMPKNGKKKFFNKKLLFYCCLLALPLLQYAVFYVYMNFNSFYLAFTKRDVFTNASSWAGFANFKFVLRTWFKTERPFFLARLKNSLVFYVFQLIVGTGGAVIFSYYIYKKKAASGFFKVILFLPQIIPGVAMISMYKIFMQSGVQSVIGNALGIDSFFSAKAEVTYPTVLFFSLFMGFGTQVLMYVGAMNNINPAVVEAARLDGASFGRELWSITVPCIYSTVVTFCVVNLTGIFTADIGLYSIFGGNIGNQKIGTLGYYLFSKTAGSTEKPYDWPEIAAIGLLFTLVVAPITIGLKSFLDRRDPMNAARG